MTAMTAMTRTISQLSLGFKNGPPKLRPSIGKHRTIYDPPVPFDPSKYFGEIFSSPSMLEQLRAQEQQAFVGFPYAVLRAGAWELKDDPQA